MAIERRVSPKERLNALAERKKQQEANLRALRESTANQKAMAEKKAVLESQDMETELKSQREIMLENMAAPVRKQYIRKAAMEAMNKVKSDGTRMLTNKILFELVYESLWVDEAVKKREVRPMFECFMDTKNFLEQACPQAFETQKTKLTAAIESVIKETVDEVYGRIRGVFEEAMRSDDYDERLLDKLKFNLTPEEEEKMDAKLTDMGQSQIVNLVKKKVLTVVQDEKKRGEKRAELFDELDEAAGENDEEQENSTEDNSTEDATTESEPGESGTEESGDENTEGNEPEEGEDSTEETDDTSEEEPEDEGAETSMDADDNQDNAGDEAAEKEAEESYVPVEEMIKSKSFWGKLQAKKKRRKGNMEGEEPDDDDDEDSVEESLQVLAYRRKIQELNRMGASSVFEGLNMFNRQVAQRAIMKSETPVSESMVPEMVASASMMQSLMQYTTMEALNTLQYCNLNRVDMNRIRMTLNKASSNLATNADAKVSLTGQL